MRISVKVKTRSSQEGVSLDGEGLYTVRVKTPPVDNKANERVQVLLAKYFGVAKTSVQLLIGGKSRTKVFEVQGVVDSE